MLAIGLLFVLPASAAETVDPVFEQSIKPILSEYCYDCHGDGADKGGITLDAFQNSDELLNSELWLKVLKNVRAGIMPPPKKAQPAQEEKAELERWIKTAVFKSDPLDPDPGRVVVRRLNRVEYRNTIRDLMGIDFDTDQEFPADDSGNGFDNMASVLTISPMLMEKYLDAARKIVSRAVPTVSGVPAQRSLDGRSFVDEKNRSGPLTLSYYRSAAVSNSFRVNHAGGYEIVLNLATSERGGNQFDYNSCIVTFAIDGEEVLRREFAREGNKPFVFKFNREWNPGMHAFSLTLTPQSDEPPARNLGIRLNSVVVRGPFVESLFVKPPNYDRFFPRPVPSELSQRRAYAAEILRGFAERACRRPVDDTTVERLVSLAERVYQVPEQTFESGISHAMTAVLASPRFLFREERIAPGSEREKHPWLDDFSLASRLSYFLWSTMPDDELFRLARKGTLRTNLHSQLKRMLTDRRSEEFIRNFGGQWLQTRDIDNVQINARDVRIRESGNKNDDSRMDFDGGLRNAMRQETERYFEYVVRNDRSVLELIESDYTFLNERLAKHYGLEELNVRGSELRRVSLPKGSPRGGVLTHGSVLAVTSNPTRTSPVKRGLFVLENILGTPPPPPPPNIPALEDSANPTNQLTLRETLEIHRQNPACSSCHNRMDPIGLAFENFNAMGMFRTNELNQPIAVEGRLVSGETFESVQELKHILATRHAHRFYETLAEKLLMYALGRGLEAPDITTVDSIAERLEKSGGRFSAALVGVIDSPAFQKTRNPDPVRASDQRKTDQARR